GDVTKILAGDINTLFKPDLLIGGSPCQNLSVAGNGMGLLGEKSILFYEYVRILLFTKPKYFILENVASMKPADKNKISEVLGIEAIMLDASLVSAQSRKRLFWVGILEGDKYIKADISIPKDRNIYLKDIIESGEVDRLKSYCLDASYYKGASWKQYKERGSRQLVKLGHVNNSDSQGNRIYDFSGKSATLQSASGGLGAKCGLYTDSTSNDNIIRKLTPTECETLMGLEKGYTSGISDTQRYKCIGNAFHVDIISHILKELIK